MAEPNGNGMTAALESRERVHSVTKDDYAYGQGGVVNWVLSTYGAWGNQMSWAALPERLPAYNRFSFFSRRDQTLMATPYYEGMWADTIGIAVTKTAAWNWEIDSPVALRRKRIQQILQQSTAGIFSGWVPFLSAHLQSFLYTGKAFVEIERESNNYLSRVRALHHLNPLRCQITDDPKTPVLYYDKNGGVHELPYYSVMIFGDMVNATLGEYALVMSAAERAYPAITLLSGISRYIYEKVTGARPTALHFIQGITQQHLNDSIASAQADRERQNRNTYMGAAAVPIPGDIQVQVVTVPLAEVPDKFDPQNLRDDAYIQYANATGLDVNDIDPRLAQRNQLGSGAQSLILNEKSKGRGLTAWKQQWLHNLNFWVLDTQTTFAFNEKSLEDDERQGRVNSSHVTNVKTMIEAGLITADQGKNILVDAGVLPREFISEDETGGDALGDDDKETGQTGTAVQETQPPQAQQPQPPQGKTPAPANGKPAEKPAQERQKELWGTVDTAVTRLKVAQALDTPDWEMLATAVLDEAHKTAQEADK